MNAPQKTILLVEDDPRISAALSIRLQSEGYKTQTAPDALTGIQQAARHDPDLVLLDITMPGGDGFSVAHRIRKSSAKELPIIFITASRRPGQVDRAIELGAAGYFEKPFLTDQLLVAVRRSLGEA